MPNEYPHGHRNGRHEGHDGYSDERARSAAGERDFRNAGGRSAGGRSEDYAQQRDAEQMRAGYSRSDWNHDARGDSRHNTRSEPAWDPERGLGQARARPAQEEHQDGSRSYDRDRFSYAGRGAGEPAPREAHWHGADPRDERGFRSGTGDEREAGAHHFQDAGRRLLGKFKRLVRNPKNYRRSDERIREDICDRLSVSDEVDPVEIEVSVSNGEVTLTGTVQERHMKFAAEEIADSVPGAHEVNNQLRIKR